MNGQLTDIHFSSNANHGTTEQTNTTAENQEGAIEMNANESDIPATPATPDKKKFNPVILILLAVAAAAALFGAAYYAGRESVAKKNTDVAEKLSGIYNDMSSAQDTVNGIMAQYDITAEQLMAMDTDEIFALAANCGADYLTLQGVMDTFHTLSEDMETAKTDASAILQEASKIYDQKQQELERAQREAAEAKTDKGNADNNNTYSNTLSSQLDTVSTTAKTKTENAKTTYDALTDIGTKSKKVDDARVALHNAEDNLSSAITSAFPQAED